MVQDIKIGTRSSKLALWQAEKVQQLLRQNGIAASILPVKSEGDLDLVTPLYAMGVEGVFTKTLDAFLLSGKIDIAVHSMKDVPTRLAQGIVQAAVLKRAATADIFIPNPNMKKSFSVSDDNVDRAGVCHIASGSVRRRAQWLHRYPNTRFEQLRGNVHTRMQKLKEHNWDGIIMAKAGLERVNLLPEKYEEINWMLPAPAQGAILVVCRNEDKTLQGQLQCLHDEQTALCVGIERDFLGALMGGCSMPIGALAELKEDKVFFKGNILLPDGRKKMEIEKEIYLSDAAKTGDLAAKELLTKGADAIVKAIRNF